VRKRTPFSAVRPPRHVTLDRRSALSIGGVVLKVPNNSFLLRSGHSFAFVFWRYFRRRLVYSPLQHGALMLTRRWLRTCVLAPLFISPGLAQAAPNIDCPPYDQTAIKLRTAKGGLYYNLVGRAIAESFNKQKASDVTSVQAVCSQGSAENIQKLGNTTGTLFAIVQSDVAHAAWYGHPWLESCPEVHDQNLALTELPLMRPGVITPLYTEAMHILLRPHFNISGLGDLRGRKVWAGAAGSGGRFSAERIFSTAGASFCSVDFVGDPATGGREITQAEALKLLGEMRIDAVFFTGPVPTHQLQDALDRFPEIHFFPLSYDLVHKLTLDESYTEALIRGEDYGKSDSILTVGVEALLMTNEKAAPKEVGALAAFIHYQSRDLRDSLRDIIETGKAIEHDEEIAKLTENPGILLRRLNRWRNFKQKREILRKIESLSAESNLYLTYDEKEALKDYMESEESHDGVARLPLLDLPTPDALVPDFYSGTPVVIQYFSHPRGPAWTRQLVVALIGCLLLLTSIFVWMRTRRHRILVRHPDAVRNLAQPFSG
jgi:TRAP transporter TAXI family solute receptor